MGTESQPVNECRYHRGILKQIRPFRKRQIGRHNRTAFLTPIRYDFEQ